MSNGSSDDCDDCAFRHMPFCGAVLGPNRDTAHRGRKTDGTVRARQNLYKQGEARGRVMVLRDGWAIRFALTPDGRRQILSILLPGDIAGGEFLMRGEVRIPAQAITPVRYCAFEAGDLREVAKDDPDLVWTFADICFSGHEAVEARLVDLGRRNAEQRIARLLIEIHGRLAKRGLANGNTIPFPLRQQIIADAFGLTQVHVSRVMTSMRDRDIIRLSAGFLTILDMDLLNEIA